MEHWVSIWREHDWLWCKVIVYIQWHYRSLVNQYFYNLFWHTLTHDKVLHTLSLRITNICVVPSSVNIAPWWYSSRHPPVDGDVSQQSVEMDICCKWRAVVHPLHVVQYRTSHLAGIYHVTFCHVVSSIYLVSPHFTFLTSSEQHDWLCLDHKKTHVLTLILLLFFISKLKITNCEFVLNIFSWTARPEPETWLILTINCFRFRLCIMTGKQIHFCRRCWKNNILFLV